MSDDLTLREIQLREKGILDFLVSYCNRKKLKVYLVSGTLLGAARHKGFIPWDDDIDVGMLRSDYDQLISDKDLRKGIAQFKLEPFLNIPNGFIFAKLIDRSVTIETEQRLEGSTNNLFIDIFPIDKLPENKLKLKFHYLKAKLLVQKIGMGSTITYTNKGFHLLLDKLFCGIYRRIGIEKFAKRLDKLARKYNGIENCRKVGNVSWCLHGAKDAMNYDGLESDEKLEFEGNEYRVFGCWRQNLSKIYGDEYMKLPPIENRNSHHLRAFLNDK